MAINRKDEHALHEDVRLLGREVGLFMEKHEMKAQYVRMASHFGTTKFTAFKKAS